MTKKGPIMAGIKFSNTTIAIRDETKEEMDEIKNKMITEYNRVVTFDEVVRALLNAYHVFKNAGAIS